MKIEQLLAGKPFTWCVEHEDCIAHDFTQKTEMKAKSLVPEWLLSTGDNLNAAVSVWTP